MSKKEIIEIDDDEEDSLNIMMACTSFGEKSTIVKNWWLVHETLNTKILSFEEIPKDVHIFSMEPPKDDTEIISLIKELNYNIFNKDDRKISMIDYLLKYPQIKFDIAVLAECNNLENLFSSKPDDSPKNLLNNFKLFYNSLISNAFVIILYHVKDRFTTVEEFCAPMSAANFDYHMLLVNVFNSLFIKKSDNIYMKKRVSNVDEILLSCLINTIKEIEETFSGVLDNPEKFQETVMKIDEKYFHSRIVKRFSDKESFYKIYHNRLQEIISKK